MEKKVVYEILNTSVEELNFTARTHSCLLRANLKSLRDILIFDSKFRISALRYLGEKGADEIIAKIEEITKMTFGKIHIGMTEQEIEEFDLTDMEKIRYKQEKEISKNRKKFLETPLYRLGIDFSKYYDVDYSGEKTLGFLLYTISDECFSKPLKNVEELKSIINGLGLPNIYFGMSKQEIDELYVSEEILMLLENVIFVKTQKRNIEMDIKAIEANNEIIGKLGNNLSLLVDNILAQEKSLTKKKKILATVKELLLEYELEFGDEEIDLKSNANMKKK